MLALERSLLRGFLSAAESLEWKQGEVAAAGEGRSRLGGEGEEGAWPFLWVSGTPTSLPVPGRAGAAAGGSLCPPSSRPVCPLPGSGGLLPAPRGGGGPLGLSVWRGGSGSTGGAEARGAAAGSRALLRVSRPLPAGPTGFRAEAAAAADPGRSRQTPPAAPVVPVLWRLLVTARPSTPSWPPVCLNLVLLAKHEEKKAGMSYLSYIL